jgi:hypothetical protein
VRSPDLELPMNFYCKLCCAGVPSQVGVCLYHEHFLSIKAGFSSIKKLCSRFHIVLLPYYAQSNAGISA